MADEPGVLNAARLIRSTAIFRELSNDRLAEIWSRAKLHNLLRGEILGPPEHAVGLRICRRIRSF